MADPRLTIVLDGNDANYETFKIDNSTITYSATEVGGSSKVGLAVNLSADNTIQTVGDGEAVLGKLASVSADNYARVQVRGFMTLPAGNSASLTLNKQIVGALNASSAEGYIREVSTSTAAELGLCRGMIIDNDTTTAVVVYL